MSTELELAQLKVGDKVFICSTATSFTDVIAVGVVSALTAIGIKVNDTLYRKTDGRKRGSHDPWHWQYIKPFNEDEWKLIEQHRNKRRLVKLFQDTRFQDLSLEALQELLTVLQKHRKVTNVKPISDSQSA